MKVEIKTEFVEGDNRINRITGIRKGGGLRREAGLTLSESVLVLGVSVVLAGLAYTGYTAIMNSVKPRAVGEDTLLLVDKVRQLYGPSGSFVSLTAANLNKQLTWPLKSFKYESSNVVDAYGNNVTMDGSTTKFAFRLGPYDQDVCAQIAPLLFNSAHKMNIGTAAALTGTNAGTINTAVGTVAKNGSAITDGAVATGCGGGGAYIAIEVR